MATRDRINIEIHQLILARLAEWQKQRQELVASTAHTAARIAELDAMITEAETELATVAGKLGRG